MAWKVSNTPTAEKTSDKIVSDRQKAFECMYRARFGNIYSGVIKEIFIDVQHLSDMQIKNSLDAIANGNVKRVSRGDIVTIGDILYASARIEEELVKQSHSGCQYCNGSGVLPVIQEYYTNRFINPFADPKHGKFYFSIVFCDCVCKGTDQSILKITSSEEFLINFISRCTELKGDCQ